MKIFYVYQKNYYAAILAAYIHLGINNSHPYKNIYIDKMQYKYCGISRSLDEIYIANCGKNKEIFINLLEGWGKINDIELKIFDLCMLDRLPYLLSRKLTKRMLEKKLEELFNENSL